MRRHTEDLFEDDEFGDSDDWNDSESAEDFDTEPVINCPYCGTEMLEICPQCPACGQYLSNEDQHSQSHPRWILLTAILCLTLVAFWLLG